MVTYYLEREQPTERHDRHAARVVAGSQRADRGRDVHRRHLARYMAVQYITSRNRRATYTADTWHGTWHCIALHYITSHHIAKPTDRVTARVAARVGPDPEQRRGDMCDMWWVRLGGSAARAALRALRALGEMAAATR